MTTREEVHELVEQMSEDDVRSLLVALKLSDSASDSGRPFLDGREYPSLEAIWNNESDAIFDRLPAE